jgi:hypothetical protein
MMIAENYLQTGEECKVKQAEELLTKILVVFRGNEDYQR